MCHLWNSHICAKCLIWAYIGKSIDLCKLDILKGRSPLALMDFYKMIVFAYDQIFSPCTDKVKMPYFKCLFHYVIIKSVAKPTYFGMLLVIAPILSQIRWEQCSWRADKVVTQADIALHRYLQVVNLFMTWQKRLYLFYHTDADSDNFQARFT